MKIEFEKIIEAANTRKEILQELQRLVQHAKVHHDNLLEIINWMSALYSNYNQLDKEGRALLPEKINVTLAYLGSTVNALNAIRYEENKGVFHLIPEDSE